MLEQHDMDFIVWCHPSISISKLKVLIGIVVYITYSRRKNAKVHIFAANQIRFLQLSEKQ